MTPRPSSQKVPNSSDTFVLINRGVVARNSGTVHSSEDQAHTYNLFPGLLISTKVQILVPRTMRRGGSLAVSDGETVTASALLTA